VIPKFNLLKIKKNLNQNSTGVERFSPSRPISFSSLSIKLEQEDDLKWYDVSPTYYEYDGLHLQNEELWLYHLKSLENQYNLWGKDFSLSFQDHLQNTWQRTYNARFRSNLQGEPFLKVPFAKAQIRAKEMYAVGDKNGDLWSSDIDLVRENYYLSHEKEKGEDVFELFLNEVDND